MAQPSHAVASPTRPSRWAALRPRAGGLASPLRVRTSMYLAFLALVLAVVLQGTLTLWLEPRWSTAVLVVMLGVLALVVVEPTARAVALQAEHEARQGADARRLALVAQRTAALVLITDDDDRIEWANAAFTHTTGWRLDEVKGLRPDELLHNPAADPQHGAQLRSAVHRGTGLRQQGLHRARDGSKLRLDVDLRALHDRGGALTGFVRVASDMTSRRLPPDAPDAPDAFTGDGGPMPRIVGSADFGSELSINAGVDASLDAGPKASPEAATQSRIDALTQLPNRAAVLARLQRAIAHAGRHPGFGFAVFFMDFDRFKQVNENLGHAAGDELLRQIALRLQHVLRPGDVLARLKPDALAGGDVAARIGGDQFVIVLEGVNSLDRVTAVADRVLKDLSEPYLIGCAPLHSSASIGVVLHRGVAIDSQAVEAPVAEDVVRNAAIAMYEAKRAGRARWVLFDNSMQERAARALAIENDLRRALQSDELFVVYQPVLDLHSRALAGVEALVRWRHPERGLVGPVDFIGVAEDSGLIDEVGALVMHKACQDFVHWRAALGVHAPPQLAVNVSRAQLKRPGVVDELAAMLQASGMQPEWLQLEVTEGPAEQDEAVQATLRRIRALGVKLALDDFGTGYSSLSYLHQLPVDTVKVDRSFVQHAQTVEHHRVLIEATIRVARTLGMATVAEGIETEDQAALMLSLQCDRGQGYLLGRPMDAAALEAWVRAELMHNA